MSKTAYVIGAGFSVGVGAPSQSNLINSAFALDTAQLPEHERTTFEQYRSEFEEFLSEDLCTDKQNFNSVTLENVFTPLDRCIIDNTSFRGRSRIAVVKLRQHISAVIMITIKQCMREPSATDYVTQFAHRLVEKKRQAGAANDPVAVLSLNWDIALDNALRREIAENEGVVDYCCYVTSYNRYEKVMPGLLARGKGMFNLKLLKLHGSMNWLQCPQCQRLFVTYFQKIAIHEFVKEPTCRFCTRNFRSSGARISNSKLSSQLIMPTFLKDLNNVQLKLIWQNAGIEIAEATHLVFMGYSFPEADFELRQLLARHVRSDAHITVVLKTRPQRGQLDTPADRYRSFFGRRDPQITYEGVAQYVRSQQTVPREVEHDDHPQNN